MTEKRFATNGYKIQRINELEESLGFCRDLLDGTCNSTRMKQLHDELNKVVTDD